MADIDHVKNDNANIDNASIKESAAKAEDVGAKKKKDKRKKRTLAGSVMAKAIAFLLLVVSSFVASAAVFCCAPTMTTGLYGGTTLDDIVENMEQYLIEDVAYKMKGLIESGAEESKIEAYFAARNVDVEIWRLYGEHPVWGTYDGSYEPMRVMEVILTFDQSVQSVYLGGFFLPTGQKYRFIIYVDPDFPQDDSFLQVYKEAAFLYKMRYNFMWTALGAGAIAALCLSFLICCAGSKSDTDELELEGIQLFELDLIAATLGVVGVFYLTDMLNNQMGNFYILSTMLMKGGTIAIGIAWLTLCLYDVIRQIKYRKWWKHTLSWCFFRGCCTFIFSIPFVLRTLLIYLSLCAVEFVICVFFMQPEGLVYLLAEKLILLPAVVYVAVCCKKFLFAGRVLTEGNQDYKLDTSKMVGSMKEHGQNLNSISQGISVAVEERIKSERLKTELITNVSHDLKTPLTSIINYSRLISEAETENETVTEYAQVLLRQSERLKKLLEDLVEASKATTGNLEVNPVPCDVGVILSQAVGEYQQRLEEKELDLIISQPEEPMRIMADGRHLWRVFDNLLNNICKYAQESSRVYLNVEQQRERVLIVFRNMSKYALSMPADELEERFVRGDKSRHMEGNGLGLPIAKTLIELQNGKMEIVIDGDLFKVILSFDRLLE